MPKQRTKDADGLTPAERRFADEYLVDLNITEAAKRALGMEHEKAKKAGWKLLQKPDVQTYIARRMKERAARTQVNQDLVMKGLLGIAQDAQATESARVRAWELLGRMVGISFKPDAARPPPAATEPRDTNLEAMTDEQLLEEAERIRGEIGARSSGKSPEKDRAGAEAPGRGRAVRNLRPN